MSDIEIKQVPNEQYELMLKAEVDIQISTAKTFPRDIVRAIADAKAIATMNQDIAQSCVYALPRGGATIEGPSVRLAEILVSTYGNIRAGMRIINNDGKTITAQGICHDLEKNNCVTIEVNRRITNKKGQTYNDDMQTVTGNAACAIAFRNAVFKVIPASLVEEVFNATKEKIKGSVDDLPQRRKKAIAHFAEIGVELTDLFRVLGVEKEDEINRDLFQTMLGIATAIKNGDSTIDDIFGVKDPKDKIRKKDGEAPQLF